jgi:hypothetical protein
MGNTESAPVAAEEPLSNRFAVERINRNLFLDVAQESGAILPVSKFEFCEGPDGCISKAQATKIIDSPVSLVKYARIDTLRERGGFLTHEDVDLLEPLDSIRKSECIIIAVSHAFSMSDIYKNYNSVTRQRSSKTMDLDADTHEEFTLFMEALECVVRRYAATMSAVYVWYRELMTSDEYYANLDVAIGSSDCLLSPLLERPGPDGSIQPWRLIETPKGLYNDYKSPAWNGSPGSYLTMRSCLLEMWFASLLPVASVDTDRMCKFSGEVYLSQRCKYRPHIIFGSRELRMSESGRGCDAVPIILPLDSLQQGSWCMRELNPSIGGLWSELWRGRADSSEKRGLDHLSTVLLPYLTALKATYKGQRNESGEMHGVGRVTFRNGVTFSGNFVHGKRQGFGQFIFPTGGTIQGYFDRHELTGFGRHVYANGDLYVGNFLDGQRDGHGEEHFANGGTYKGQYKADVREGHGEYVGSDGSKYTGSFLANQPSGYGAIKYANGDTYQGQFYDGHRQGPGEIVYANGDRYEGQFYRNRRHGIGVLATIGKGFHPSNMFVGSSQYEGHWYQDTMEGSGRFKFANGDEYQGTFLNNAMDGVGVFRWRNGNVYEGQFMRGLQHGHGVMVHATVNEVKGSVYDGNWRESKRHGIGKFVGRDGSIYFGEFSEDKMHGKGKFNWKNGDVYQGDFFENMMHGTGKLVHASGNVYAGGFKYDRKNGKGSIINANGQIYNGYWRDGVLDSQLMSPEPSHTISQDLLRVMPATAEKGPGSPSAATVKSFRSPPPTPSAKTPLGSPTTGKNKSFEFFN